jgi:hypothetical protein
MLQHEPTFHYRIGWFARLFGSADHNEIVLADRVLHLARRDGSNEMLDPDDLVPQISHSKGLCWDSLSFRLRDGRHRRVAGIRRAEAQTLGRMLEAWVAPVRERFFADLERKLQATEALVAPLLDGSHYVRHSEVVAAVGPLRASIAEIALLSAVSGGLPGLVERTARLRAIPKSLSDDVAQSNERFVSAELTRHSRLFDTVEAKPLTAAQRRACVIDDDHNLVLAGAGTGKTSVMIGRAGYLLAIGMAHPESLLMAAYNRDAAQELRERATRRLEGVADVGRLPDQGQHQRKRQDLSPAGGRRDDRSRGDLRWDDLQLGEFRLPVGPGRLSGPRTVRPRSTVTMAAEYEGRCALEAPRTKDGRIEIENALGGQVVAATGRGGFRDDARALELGSALEVTRSEREAEQRERAVRQ